MQSPAELAAANGYIWLTALLEQLQPRTGSGHSLQPQLTHGSFTADAPFAAHPGHAWVHVPVGQHPVAHPPEVAAAGVHGSGRHALMPAADADAPLGQPAHAAAAGALPPIQQGPIGPAPHATPPGASLVQAEEGAAAAAAALADDDDEDEEGGSHGHSRSRFSPCAHDLLAAVSMSSPFTAVHEQLSFSQPLLLLRASPSCGDVSEGVRSGGVQSNMSWGSGLSCNVHNGCLPSGNALSGTFSVGTPGDGSLAARAPLTLASASGPGHSALLGRPPRASVMLALAVPADEPLLPLGEQLSACGVAMGGPSGGAAGLHAAPGGPLTRQAVAQAAAAAEVHAGALVGVRPAADSGVNADMAIASLWTLSLSMNGGGYEDAPSVHGDDEQQPMATCTSDSGEPLAARGSPNDVPQRADEAAQDASGAPAAAPTPMGVLAAGSAADAAGGRAGRACGLMADGALLRSPPCKKPAARVRMLQRLHDKRCAARACLPVPLLHTPCCCWGRFKSMVPPPPCGGALPTRCKCQCPF